MICDEVYRDLGHKVKTAENKKVLRYEIGLICRDNNYSYCTYSRVKVCYSIYVIYFFIAWKTIKRSAPKWFFSFCIVPATFCRKLCQYFSKQSDLRFSPGKKPHIHQMQLRTQATAQYSSNALVTHAGNCCTCITKNLWLYITLYIIFLRSCQII